MAVVLGGLLLLAGAVLGETGGERSEEVVGFGLNPGRDEALARRALVQALGMVQGELAAGRATGAEMGAVCVELAGLFDLRGKQVLELTDLEVVPELSEESSRWRRQRGEVLVEGRTPVVGPDDGWRLPELRERFEDAATDGERVHWLWHEAVSRSGGPGGSRAVWAKARLGLAKMWHGMLGVDGLVSAGYVYVEGTESEFDPEAPGEFELHTLKDHETFVVGVHGPGRRVIPERCRYVPMLRELVGDEGTPAGIAREALDLLLKVLTDRYQYSAAEAVAGNVLARKGVSDEMRRSAERLLAGIAPSVRFHSAGTFSLAEPVTVEVITRGVSELRIVLWRLDVEKFLATGDGKGRDLIEGFATGQNNWWLHRGLEQKHADALFPCYMRVTEWVEPVRMKANHLQTVGRVTVPVQEAGSYLLAVEVGGKHQVWSVQVARSILLSAALEAPPEDGAVPGAGANLFLLDAESGRPVVGAQVEPLRGGESSVSDPLGHLPGLTTGGLCVIRRPGNPPELLEVEGGWLYRPPEPATVESFLVTNQPLYRPGQSVEFAGWLKRPHWRDGKWGGLEEGSEVEVRVTDPVGIVLFERKIVLDGFGGFAGSFVLPTDMVLGDCEVHLAVSDIAWATSGDPFDADAKDVRKWEDLDGRRGWSWRIGVGEFRKPDFRVVVEPDACGTGFAVVVRAAYNSGEPLAGAVVKARVRGWPVHMNLFPKEEWDDLYWAGYDWGLPRTPWMADWDRWGIRSEDIEDWDNDDPERDGGVVVELDGVTDEAGAVRLVVPGGMPMQDRFEYDCDVRVGVREFTGRSVGAETRVFLTGRPHEGFLRPGRRFCRAGDPVRVDLWTIDGKREPVPGRDGVFRLEMVDVVEGGVTFTPVWEKRVTTGADGRTQVEFEPPGAGQYRCVFGTGGGERGFVLEVLGDRRAPGSYDGVQVIPEQAVAKVGDEIEVLVQTEDDEAVVWLFEQMPDGVRRPPRLVGTRNQMALVKLPVTRGAVPEFYLLAATVVDGTLKKAKCRIVVPPVETQLSVAMTVRPERAAPGDEAGVEIAVTDAAGAPAEASLAVTVFDRSLEDLGGALPKAGRTMRDRFEGEVWPASSQEMLWDNHGPFVRIPQPGCFADRDLYGDPRWRATARFERIGGDLWRAYEPPELPNHVEPDAFEAFPVMPGASGPVGAGEAALGAAARSGMAKVGLRKRFADRAWWGAAMRTDGAGRVQAAFGLPDNLTTWRVQSWAFGTGNQFGDGQAGITVSKDLQLRPLLPRSMVVGDELLVGALVQNLSGMAGEFQVAMEAGGVAVEGAERVVRLAAGAEGRADWKVRPETDGAAVFRFRVRSADGGLTDGAEVTVPVSPRRVPVTVAAQDEIEKGERDLRLDLKVREPVGSGVLRVRVEGSPALGALAVLPDLVSYPHGCAEQTLNRFLPTLIAWQAADELGLDWEAVERSMIADDRAMGWISGRSGPVRRPAPLTEERVRGMIMVGLSRLKELQGKEGSWGWFSPEDQRDAAFLTALAVRGMARAGEYGFRLDDDPVKDGVEWLRRWASNRETVLAKTPEKVMALDAFVVHVLAKVDDRGAPDLREVLLEMRDRLDAAGLIHLALAMEGNEGNEIRRLFSAATEAMDPVKAGLVKGTRWWEDEVELRAWYLKLLVKMEADEVVLRSGIRGLLDKRTDGVRWKSTRDSGLCVEAIIEAALACGGFGLDEAEALAVTVAAAGVEMEVELSGKNLWSGQVTLPLDGLAMSARVIPVELRGDGNEALQVAAVVSYDTDAAEEMVAAAHGIEVERRYFRITQGTKGRERKELTEGDVLRVGDLVEVELRTRCGEQRSFVHLRDPVPAGLEPLMELSGYEDGSYRESRTGETHFFVSALGSGTTVQSYHLRAVTAGRGLALPARAECMYAPAVFGRSDRREIVVD